MNYLRRADRGFSLIEISIAMVVIGLIASGVLQAYSNYLKKEEHLKQSNIASTLQQALQDYAQKNGHLPCPAPVQGSAAGNAYDTESRSTPGGSCLVTMGISRLAGSNGQQVLVGKVPAEDLKITNDYMRDAFGSYLVYAVTQAATAPSAGVVGGVTVEENGIDLTLSSSTYGQIVKLATHTDALYAIVSTGKNRLGSIDHDGGRGVLCASLGPDEAENCDGDAVFLKSLMSEGSIANPFDDLVLFDTEVGLIASIPEVVHLARAGTDYDYRRVASDNHEFTMKKDGIVEHGTEDGVQSSVPVEVESGDIISVKPGPSGIRTDSGNIRNTMQLYVNGQMVPPVQSSNPAYGPPPTSKDYIFASGNSGQSDFYHVEGAGSVDNSDGTAYPGFSTRIWVK